MYIGPTDSPAGSISGHTFTIWHIKIVNKIHKVRFKNKNISCSYPRFNGRCKTSKMSTLGFIVQTMTEAVSMK